MEERRSYLYRHCGPESSTSQGIVGGWELPGAGGLVLKEGEWTNCVPRGGHR